MLFFPKTITIKMQVKPNKKIKKMFFISFLGSTRSNLGLTYFHA